MQTKKKSVLKPPTDFCQSNRELKKWLLFIFTKKKNLTRNSDFYGGGEVFLSGDNTPPSLKPDILYYKLIQIGILTVPEIKSCQHKQ